MQYSEASRALARLGTAQNRKIYQRHGSGPNLHGVSFANLQKLKKKIRTDHALAKKLWASKNQDERTLAAMIADPAKMSSKDLDAWAKSLDYYVVTDVFVRSLVSESPHATKKIRKWTRSKSEWIGRAGWLLLASIAMRPNELSDEDLESYLPTIEKGIHSAKNRTRDAMNSALIAIGMRSARLERAAIAAARRIGKVAVDHGDTSCKTPDAIPYIERARAHAKKKASRKSAARGKIATPKRSTRKKAVKKKPRRRTPRA